MLDLIVYIKCSGANVREDNLFDTIYSFEEKNKKEDYKFYIVVDSVMERGLLKIIDDIPSLWDGQSSTRISQKIMEFLGKR